ncbi:GumC family protein [Geminocystis herdmanii]|uniref:GumC family protein n=1 Tax=Geminocystis herdmanii TaxID=669359 RepID=UPI0003475BFA|nr:polysaccharide biosynthesis tyrosine autokinase [Geminocystis herdmanii]
MFLKNSTNSHSLISENSELNPPIYINSQNTIDDEEIDLGELFKILQRRSLIIIGTTITLTSILTTWILSKPPVYTGTVRMQVESVTTEGSGLGGLAGLAAAGGGAGRAALRGGLDYESLTSILKSPFVMDSIVQDIQKKYPEIIYLPNPNKDLEELEQKEVLSENLNVQQPGLTKTLSISYQSDSPEKILDILNEIVDGYLAFQAKESVQNPTQQLEFTIEQISRLRQRVAGLESQVESFQKKNNLISPDALGSTLNAQVTFLNQEKNRALVESRGIRKLASQLEQKLDLTPEEGVIVARLNREPYYLKLVNQIKDTESKIATEGVRFGFEHPTIKKLEAEKDELIVLLELETQRVLGKPYKNLPLDFFTSFSNNQQVTQQFFDTNNQIEVLEARQQSIDEAQKILTQEINNLSTTQKEFIQLQRELRIATENLTRLLALRENLEIEVARQFSPWRLLTPIDENIIQNTSGKKKQIALVGIGSLFLGTMLGFVVDKLDSKLYSSKDVKNMVNLPVLITIPANKKLFSLTPQQFMQKESMVLRGLLTDNSKTFNLDHYFSLYSNINALSLDRTVSSITIGTVDAKQGQSIISIYLAKAATMIGKKVLLVDMNLREPKLHSYLGLENKAGISDIIFNDIPLNEVIQTSKLDNLFLLTAGSQINNPVGILSSPKMANLTKTFKQDFDFVIYNTPPLAEFSDGKIVTPLTEGLVMIIGLGKTNRNNLEKVMNDLQISKLPVLGMVINES